MEQIKSLVKDAVYKLYGLDDFEPIITRPEANFGDFTSNVAMQLAKTVGKNPHDIAQDIKQELNDRERFAIIDIAGPGFINLTLKNDYYQQTLAEILEQRDKYGHNSNNNSKLILAEYSDPNPLKPLHAGHLYTTLVGDSIARLLQATGADVKRISYGGDVGPHVAKSMWAITQEIGEDITKLDDIPIEDRPIWLGQKYVEGNNAYEDNDTAQAQIKDINKQVYQLHNSGDRESAFAKIYWTVRQWSYDYFDDLYEKLGVGLFDRTIPESEVVETGVATVREHIPDVYQQSDGAIVFKGEKFGLHTRVFINNQDLPTYEAKEVGLIYTKWKDYKFDLSVIITANEIDQYMQVVLKSIEQFEPELVKRTRHITHGIVKLAGGVKMSSRKGNVLGFVDVIESAKHANLSVTGKDDMSAVLAAVKYSFLKQRIGGDIIYDPEESVNVLGNSGPYLQYAYVRAKSILAKAGDLDVKETPVPESAERTLVRKMDEFKEVVALAASELMPHHICIYLYELAQEFNRFYEQNKVIGSDRQAERLAILTAYTQVLGNGLDLLGIEKPQKM